MRRTRILDPYVGQKYFAFHGMDRLYMEIVNLSQPNGDAWVEFKNIDTKQSYNCRLEAFLAKYAAMPE